MYIDMSGLDKLKNRIGKSKELKNTVWIVGEQIFQMVISLVISLLTARYLGPENFGSLNYTASFISFFTSVASLGMEGVIIKKMIADPDGEGEYLGSCIVFRLLSSVLSSVTIILLVYFLNPDDRVKVLLAFLQSFQLIFQAFYIFDSWFQRYLKSKYVSIGKMAACVIVAGYKIFLLATGKSVLWFAFSSSLTYIVISIVLFIFYKREKGRKLRVSFIKGKDVLSESYHFIIAGLMVAVYGQMDKIMIGQILTDADVGLYATSTAICSMWIFIPIAIINSFRPSIMVIKNSGDEKRYVLRLEQLYSLVIWLSIFISVIVTILAPFIVYVMYGDEYMGAVDTLRIAVWLELFSMIGTARGIWILCENKNKYVKYYLFIGVIVNLVLNSLFIPWIGIIGAAIATLVTQITTSIIAPMCFKETRVHTKYVLEAFVLKWYFKGGNLS